MTYNAEFPGDFRKNGFKYTYLVFWSDLIIRSSELSIIRFGNYLLIILLKVGCKSF